MNEPASKAPRRSRLRLALAIAGVALAIVALLLYAARRTLAREALVAWLRAHGVAASADVEGLGFTDVTGSLAIGDPRRPDFTAERAEVGYGLRGLSLEVRSVRLVRPVLRARWHDGRFSAGALDRLIAELRKGPPNPQAPQPRIEIEGGRLLLATDYGPLQLDADAVLAEGRLQRLTARAAPGRLRGRGVDVGLGAATLTAQAAGPRLELSLDAPVASAAWGPLAVANTRLRFTAAGPYPDLARKHEQGSVAAHAELSGGRIAWAGQTLRNGLVSAALTGDVAGGLEDFALTGRAVADLRAGAAEAAGGTAGPVRAAASAEDLSWTRKGGDVVRAKLALNASLDSFTRPDMKFTQVQAALQGKAGFAHGRADFDLAAHALGHAAWSGLGAPVATDSADIVALKRAARGFRFAAPGLALRGAGGQLGARLLEPVRLAPDAGGAVTLSPAGAGWRLTVAGGGLPRIDAAVDRFALAPGGAVAHGRIQAALSLGPAEGGVYDAAGELRLANGAIAFAGERCAEASAQRLNFGQNDVRRFSARLCPAGQPMVSLAHGDWRISGRAEDVSGEAPFLQAKLAKGAGALDLASVRGELRARLAVDHAEASDAAPERRFNPVQVVGEAHAARGRWDSALSVRDPAGRQIARIAIRQEDASGSGRADIETGTLHFAQGGLQPAELSPLAAAIGAPAEGEARFAGGFAWSAKTQASSGVLEIPRLDFKSPLGKVSGLAGRVVFSSLAPLVAAPGQTLTAPAVAAPAAPLTQVRIVFGLTPEAIQVTDAQAAVGGGVARIEGLQIPLAKDQPIHGVLDLQGVQLHDPVEASPFGDKVDLDARVSGRAPFTVEGGDKVRVAGGALRAIQPGRLSIQRAALTGVAAQGAVAAPGVPAAAAPKASTDTFSDFAYQAMENLAFSTLTATVDSRPDGRLGVIFHIVGRHDPPRHEEIRLSLMDLIQKRFMGRQLPLPSGTGVDLTLDTTLNLDDLMDQWLHGSAQVQP